MARIGPKDTAPEMMVRRAAHAMGLRFRLHRRDLPGSPDLVFVGRRLAVFVHGCFWHCHGCNLSRQPKTRSEFWRAKFERNRARDARNVRSLRRQGWTVGVIWECKVRSLTEATRMLEKAVARAAQNLDR